MKQIISILSFLFLFLVKGQAQDVYYSHLPKKHHMCAGTIVGMSSLTVGFAATIGGFAMELSAGANYEHSYGPAADAKYQRDRNTADAVRDAGIVLGIAGLGLLIGGITHDIIRHHKHKLNLIAPKRNEIGFAYNF